MCLIIIWFVMEVWLVIFRLVNLISWDDVINVSLLAVIVFCLWYIWGLFNLRPGGGHKK